jgi:hypothetical protein
MEQADKWHEKQNREAHQAQILDPLWQMERLFQEDRGQGK